MPSDLVDEIREMVFRGQYEALKHLFEEYRQGGTEYLSLDEADASNLLRLADIEMSKAILTFPHAEYGGPLYNPEHEERYDDVMMGFCEKIYYYVQSEFKALAGQK